MDRIDARNKLIRELLSVASIMKGFNMTTEFANIRHTIDDLNPRSKKRDDEAVDAFAAAMKEKMAKKRHEGRSGWESCPIGELRRMLHEHLNKGDPVDIANFCMMLWNREAAKSA